MHKECYGLEVGDAGFFWLVSKPRTSRQKLDRQGVMIFIRTTGEFGLLGMGEWG